MVWCPGWIPLIPVRKGVLCTLRHTSLMSLGQLFDAGCTAHLSAQELVVSNPDTTPLYRGQRNRAPGLWDIEWRQPFPLQSTTALAAASANAVFGAPTTQTTPAAPESHVAVTPTQRSNAHALNALRLSSNAERVHFYHAAMGSPPEVTLTKALSAGILPTLLITAELVRKTQPQTLATAEGHLDAHHQGIQSTQTKPTAVKHKQIIDEICSFPDVDTAKPPGASIIVNIYEAKKEIDIDPAGRLPTSTQWGGENHVVFISMMLIIFTWS
jgi:hypothetical protein